MKKLITICAVVGLIMAVTGTVQAALDINGIYIDSCKNYWNGIPETNPWEFEIWVDFADTGDLDHIDIKKPGTSTPFTTIYDNDGDWYYETWPTTYPTLGNLQTVYPAGNYTFDFRDDSNGLLNSVTLDYSGIAEPCNPVQFTYPSTNGETGISTNPTFTWTVVNASAGDALGMWVEDEDTDDDIYEDVPVSMDTLDWSPGSLNPGHDYELDVSVFNVKNLEPGPALPTTTVDGDKFTYGLLIEYGNYIEFSTVPEPATICLLGLGALSLVRRKKQ